MRIIERFKEHIFTPETFLLGKFKNILVGVVLYIIWSKFIMLIYKGFVPEFKDIRLQVEHLIQINILSQEFLFVSACILAPFIEEFMYRSHLGALKNLKLEIILPYAIVMSSILFGVVHGWKDWSVPIQGVAGLILCYIYIKNGYSYISSVTTHFLINLYLFFN